MDSSTIRIGKLDAARRQLRTAITLWFNDGEPVSVHTLAYAAYEVIHTISEKRDPTRRDLLFDTALIKDEHLRDWNVLIRKHANFFKHADRDGDAIIDFNPTISEMFILYAILGRELCGETANDEESIFMWWVLINKPQILTDSGRKKIADRIPVDYLGHIQGLAKHQFFYAAMEARHANRRGIAPRRFSILS